MSQDGDGEPVTEARGIARTEATGNAERIAEVGLRLFSQNGYDATTLDDIAKVAASPAGTFSTTSNRRKKIF